MNAVNHGADRGGPPERERWISPEMVRQNERRARAAIERARAVCDAARMEQEKARARREKARWLRAPEATLPPLEYTLPPLEAALVYLDRGLPLLPEGPAEMEKRTGARRPVMTVLYAWGYGGSLASIVQMQFRPTEEARRFAAQRGWDRRRPGAWAGEQAFAVDLHATLQKIEPALRVDPSVAGWGGRLVRAG